MYKRLPDMAASPLFVVVVAGQGGGAQPFVALALRGSGCGGWGRRGEGGKEDRRRRRATEAGEERSTG